MAGYRNGAAILLLMGVALSIACVLVQGPLPGDVDLTRAVQTSLGEEPAWATFLTKTAKHPLVWITLAVGIGLAWLGGGWRGLVSVPVTFLLVKLLDQLLRAIVHAPRPTPDLVHVASPSTSSGFPSTFGLVFGAIFGTALVISIRKSSLSLVIALIALVILVAGMFARVVLGGHWMSQVLASVLLAVSLGMIALGLLEKWRPRESG